MPVIVEYPNALRQLQEQGLRCVYHNSGAFAFESSAGAPAVQVVGWIGPEDTSIRPEMRALAHPVEPADPATLAYLVRCAWEEHLPGMLWAMPKSHWAFELSDGSRDWMPALLAEIGLPPDALRGRADAAAVEFARGESEQFERFIERLLGQLAVSDFSLTFQGRPVLCTVHHHRQVWWQTTDGMLANSLRSMVLRQS